MKNKRTRRLSLIISLTMIMSLLLTGLPIYAEDTTTAEGAAVEEQASEVTAGTKDQVSVSGASTEGQTSESASDTTGSGTVSESGTEEAQASDNTTDTNDSASVSDSGTDETQTSGDTASDAADSEDNETTEEKTAVYLNGSTGDDNNDGLTADTAVKTFEKAKELAKALDAETDKTVTIYITGKVNISGSISLDGIDAIVKRDKDYSGYLMEVSYSSTAALSSITIDGNSGEAASVSSSLIHSNGTLNITDGTVLQNNTITSTGYFQSLGGAVKADSGTVNMTGGKITNNTANIGGGIFSSGAEVNVSGGVISENHAIDTYSVSQRHPGAGGGICVYDDNTTLNLSGSAQIINNTADDMGGGISVGSGNGSNEAQFLNMTGGIVSGNTAGSAGGGIFVQGGTSDASVGHATITGGYITNNQMTGKGHGNSRFGGGGIYVNGYTINGHTYRGEVTIKNGLIKDNTASIQGGGYAACPISKTHIYVTDGVAIYSNHAESANEIYILATYAYGAHGGNPTYTISPYMLGGTPYNWKYQSGKEVPLNRLEGTLRAIFQESLSLHTDVTSDAKAESKAQVFITGNTSATRGGGIGSNGTVNMGTSDDVIDITVNKEWVDEDSENRPESIEIELYRSVNGSGEDPVYVGYQTMTPDSSGNWNSITFKDLPKTDDNGNEYEYSVKERGIDGYISSVSGDQEAGFTITNTERETISIPVTKVWNGGNADKAVIHLYANGKEVSSVELNENNNWQYTFSDLYKEDEDGNTINYSITEDPVDGYTTSISGDQTNGFTVTNTKKTESEKISIPVTKVWNGGNADKAVIHLYANGTEISSVELNEDNNWQYTFTGLEKTDADGNTIQYTVTEDTVDGYVTSISGDQTSGYTVTNTKYTESAKISIPVNKVWKGGKGDKAVIHLYADGEEIDSVELNEDNDWQYTFTELDAENADGDPIEYTITEDTVEGYTTQISGNQEEGFTVTNTKHTYTDTPKKTNKKKTSNPKKTSTPKSPKTGDTSNAGLYIVILLSSAAGLILAAVYRKKKI